MTIKIPPGLLHEWREEAPRLAELAANFIADKAAEWAADQQLIRVIDWLRANGPHEGVRNELSIARLDSLATELWAAMRQQSPDHVKFWYLNDNHTLTRLEGNSLEEIVAMAFVLSRTPTGAWGSLCPAILMCGHKEVCRVGPMVHTRGANDSRDKWNEGVQEWIKALSADQDVMRLLAEKDQPPAPELSQ